MTKVLFISFLCFCYFIFGQIKVTYNVKYKPDSTTMEFNSEEMVLLKSKERSYFYNQTKFKLDSIYDIVTAEYMKTGMTSTVSMKYELNFGIIKDFQLNKFSEINNVNSRNFAFEISSSKLNWHISNEKKNVLGYTVKKAEVIFGGRKWFAWYALDIPISDGPYKFFGLPGLILELEDSNGDYTFTAVGLEKYEKDLDIPNDFLKTTREKYFKLIKRIETDPAIFVRESVSKNRNVIMKDTNGQKMDNNELFQRIIIEFRRYEIHHNNYIEKGRSWLR